MTNNEQVNMQVEEKHEPEVDVVRWDDDDLDPVPSKSEENPSSALANAILKARTDALKSSHARYEAKVQEATTKKAVILKRNELKWKLMQASQRQNKAKLDEIRSAVTYHKEKLTKTQDLVARLRAKYIRVIRAAKMSEAQLKKAESQFQDQERFVAKEKMELTKLAIECSNMGKSLYGLDYKLPENPQTTELASKMSKPEPGLSKRRPGKVENSVTHNDCPNKACRVGAELACALCGSRGQDTKEDCVRVDP